MTTSSGDRPFRASRRAPFGFLASLSVFLLFAAGCSGSGSAQEEASTQPAGTESSQGAEDASAQPNILFILTDDLDYASVEQMPQIGSLLADQGTSFERAFVSHPVCCPSRTTILTGLYDHNHNVISNNYPSGGFQKFVDEGHEENSIAVGLQERG